MLIQKDTRCLLVRIEDFGSSVTAAAGWRSSVNVLLGTANHVERNVGIYFDVGDLILSLFRYTENKDIITYKGRRYVALIPVQFKVQTD